MSAPAYKFNAEDLPKIPGALWADGHPRDAPSTPLPGLPKVTCLYMPLDYHRHRTYESDEHGWIEVKSRSSAKAGWRGSKKGKKERGPIKMTMDHLISSLSGRSYLIAPM